MVQFPVAGTMDLPYVETIHESAGADKTPGGLRFDHFFLILKLRYFPQKLDQLIGCRGRAVAR